MRVKAKKRKIVPIVVTKEVGMILGTMRASELKSFGVETRKKIESELGEKISKHCKWAVKASNKNGFQRYKVTAKINIVL